MAITGERAAAALVANMLQMNEVAAAGWVRRRGDAVAWVSTAPVPTLNGVMVAGTAPDPAVIRELLAEVAASELPHNLLCRPAAIDALEPVAVEHGLSGAFDVPLMTLEQHAATTAPEPSELAIRMLAADEIDLHVELSAAGFEMPAEPLRMLMTPEMLALSGSRFYVAELHGEPIGTGFGMTLNGAVGIFNIAVLPDHRGRGYGAAITARAVRDGFAGGAEWAWLQSSPAGFGVYERLGFRTVEFYRCWITA